MPNNSAELNFLWSQTIISELANLGVRQVCLSSGARSAPLCQALSIENRFKQLMHFDERGAAFYALGASKASAIPSLLICTSGTACANYYPAIIEAYYSKTPLIVLTADRPFELQNTGSNQTINQINLYGNFSIKNFLIPAPDNSVNIEYLKSIASEAFQVSLNQAGPVHINMQFREPLCTNNIESVAKPSLVAKKAFFPAERKLSELAINELKNSISSAKAGIAVIGAIPSTVDPLPIIEFVEKLNWPCLIDITSQARALVTNRKNFYFHYNLFLKDNDFNAPDCVLHFGGGLTSKYLDSFLANTNKYFHLAPSLNKIDRLAAVTIRIDLDYNNLKTIETASLDSNLNSTFMKFEANCSDYISALINGATDQAAIVPLIFKNLPQDQLVFLGNSLTIREAESYVSSMPKNTLICYNRGASGIDGNIATAIGFAETLNRPITVIIGDLAALYDLNSLYFIKNSKVKVTLIIINNDGGEIFSKLPELKNIENFEFYFKTPHGLNFKNISMNFEIGYQKTNLKNFIDTYKNSLANRNSNLIEILP